MGPLLGHAAHNWRVRGVGPVRKSRGLSSAAWAAIRQTALDRDGWRCQTCGKAGALEVHHLVAVWKDGSNELSNLVSLCRAHHLRAHQPRRDAGWDAIVAKIVAS